MGLAYAEALAMTLAVELSACVALTRRAERAVSAAALLFTNLLTHPLAWWIVVEGGGRGWFWPVEIGVWAAEAAALVVAARLPLARACAVAGVANGATAGLSLLL